MKSYEEMAEQVLKRSEKEIEKRNKRIRKTTRIVSSLSCFCIIAVICFSVYNNEIFDLGKNAGYQEQSIATTETGEKTNEFISENEFKNPIAIFGKSYVSITSETDSSKAEFIKYR